VCSWLASRTPQQPPVQQTASPGAADASSGPADRRRRPRRRSAAGGAAPAAKFPEGAKYAFINIQRIASESTEGKASSSRIEALRAKKAAELTEKKRPSKACRPSSAARS